MRRLVGAMAPPPFRATDHVATRLGGYEPERDGHLIHVSELSDFCPRERALCHQYNIERRSYVPGWLRMIFDHGRAVEQLYRNEYLGPAGLLVGYWKCLGCRRVVFGKMPPRCQACQPGKFVYVEPVWVDDELLVRGSVDGLLVNRDELRVLQLKSLNPSDFDKLVRPLGDHAFNESWYLYLARTQRARGLPINLRVSNIIYVPKQAKKPLEFEIEYQSGPIDFVRERLADWKAYVTTKTMPPNRLCESVGSPQAKTCPAVRRCFDLPGG